ncbi:hypothetical protein MKX01_035507 [Papaver californicum]|nr:hypothetical protein MKX01_035507 [Papaver californicum]
MAEVTKRDARIAPKPHQLQQQPHREMNEGVAVMGRRRRNEALDTVARQAPVTAERRVHGDLETSLPKPYIPLLWLLRTLIIQMGHGVTSTTT